MLKDTVRFAFRNLRKNKVTSVFNIIGLTLAVSSVLCLFLYLGFELSFDRFHRDYRRIYNVYFDEYNEGVRDRYIQSPIALGNNLLEDFPEVEAMTRAYCVPKSIIKSDDGKEYMDDFIWADSSFFNLFYVKLISGNGSQILKASNQVCISRSCARKYFSDKDPVGKTLIINDEKYEIQAVFDDYPGSSHLKFDLIGSLLTFT